VAAGFLVDTASYGAAFALAAAILGVAALLALSSTETNPRPGSATVSTKA
jgi:hypothetical protein